MTLTLRSSLTSPFGRKVRMAARVVGTELDIVHADTRDPADQLRALNPLGKIPALVLADGTVLYDSRVIVDFLDATNGGGLFPADPLARARAQTNVALFDGIADAALLVVYEARWRGEAQASNEWLAHQRGKIERGLRAAEGLVSRLTALDGAAISLVAALGYLDWRRPVEWREDYPGVAAWLGDMNDRHPAVAETAPVPETTP